jgi:hypothetical protein
LGAPVHTARFAPGVIGLIMDGERPARVPNNVIDELKDREHNGIIALPKKPQLDPRAWLSVPPQNCDLADRCYRQSKKPAARHRGESSSSKSYSARSELAPTFDRTWIGTTLRLLSAKSGFLRRFTKP